MVTKARRLKEREQLKEHLAKAKGILDDLWQEIYWIRKHVSRKQFESHIGRFTPVSLREYLQDWLTELEAADPEGPSPK